MLLRRSVLALIAMTGLVMGAFVGSPASAKPAQVGAPWVKASTTTSITLDWSPVAGAKQYQVFFATSYDGALAASAISRKTSGSQSELKISSLKPKTMYCFTVRALGNGAGSRSHRHCKFTMRTNNDYTLESASIATYNVCSAAGTCYNSWKSRVPAILARIADSKVHVLGLQEASGQGKSLEALLAPSGFAKAVGIGSEALYYRTSKFTVATRSVDDCSDNDESCTPSAEPDVGSWDLGNSADAAWARLTSRLTGHTYLFVNAHLTNGKGTAESNKRRGETQQLVSLIRAESSDPVARTIILGDFNSHRNRIDDAPRKVLEAAGWHDTYDRTTNFTYPRHNSYQGFLSKPTISEKYGDHVDHIFVQDQVGSTSWKVVHKFTKVKGVYRYTTPLGSDHSPVRVTLYLP